ncbi:MAG: helix-hairpin-helix domain-containing protein [Candidatus Thermoplasmatota archaeon]|nr:helix-hairpin-helix domain-containing protein [Candidatus Thermoplasmatota archaeon]MDP7264707.1 helix-hairpin-helix domain-containing protein [Candidatus Thermoplasmatota archaeon]
MEDIGKDEILDDDDDDEKLIELMGDIFSDDDDKKGEIGDLVLLDKGLKKVGEPRRQAFDFEVESPRDPGLTVSSTDRGTKSLRELSQMEPDATELPELARDDILNVLKSVPRVGHVMAVSIVNGGFDNYHSLSTLEVSDLNNIPGLGADLAAKIVECLKKEYPLQAIKEENVGEEPAVPVEKIEEKVAPELEEKSEVRSEEEMEEKAPIPEEDGAEEKTDEVVPPTKGEVKAEDGGVGKEKKEKSGMWGKIKGLFSRNKGEADKEGTEEKADDGKNQKTSDDEVPELVGTDDKEIAPDESTDMPENSDGKTLELLTTKKEEGDSIKDDPIQTSVRHTDEKKSEHLKLIEKDAEVDGKTLKVGSPEITGTDTVSPVRAFVTILDVEEDVAVKLYSAGYRNLQELKEAIPEDLVYVEGINPTLARKIYAKLH